MSRLITILTLFLISTLILSCGGGGGGGGGGENTTGSNIQPNHASSAAVPTVPVNLPVCDANDPEVLLITDAANFDFINNPEYRIFCIFPGDYSSAGTITITSSGVEGRPRVIRLYDPGFPADDMNPVSATDSKRAIVTALSFQGAQQWIVHGLTIRGSSNSIALLNIGVSSKHNIFNYLLVEQGGSATLVLILIRDGADYNTIQNSVIRNAATKAGSDRNCINISSSIPNGLITGTLIVANEIYNCTDGIQLVVHEKTQGSLYPQTVIADNDIYITPDRYTDCHGNPDPGGACASAENGIDIKAGAATSVDSVIIEGNRIWGFRKTDTASGGSGSWGVALGTCCFTPAYILFRNNIIMDSARGISTTGADHTSIIGNLIYNIHDRYPENTGQALVISGSNHEAYLNTIVDSVKWGVLTASNIDYRCNTLINAGSHSGSGNRSDIHSDYNAYYESIELALPGVQDIIEYNVTAAQNTDRCFTRKRWTEPEQVCIPFGSDSENSPHTLNCDAELGSRMNIGVDDLLFKVKI